MTKVTDRMDDTALRLVDAIQVENSWMRDYALKLNVGRDVDIRYAPPGVDEELFHPHSTRDITRDPYILCVGRLDDPRKNVGLLLEAFAQLPKPLRNSTRLVLAGSSRPRRAFWSRAEHLGLRDRIEYVSYPSRAVLVRLYQDASVFALASDEEGLGVVLLEAMACGIPVVSTRSGGPDGIISDGSDGFLVPLGDAEQLADRVGLLLQDPAFNRAMGCEARRTIEGRFAERIAGKEFIDIWDKQLARGAQRSAGNDFLKPTQ